MEYIRTIVGTIEKLISIDDDDNITVETFPNLFGEVQKRQMKKSWMVKRSEYVEDLFNRYIIKSGFMLKVCTRLQFEKMHINKLMSDIKEGKKRVFGCVWQYGEVGQPILVSAMAMNEQGEWKAL